MRTGHRTKEIDVFISNAFAQAATAPADPGYSQFILMGAMFVVLYFVMIRPQMKRQKEHKAMIEAIAKGDEVLDWREMHARYSDCRIKLLEGSDHGLADFDDYLHELTEFLQL